MKTELTTEQSKHLIELGVPANKASTTSNQLHGDPYYNDYYQEIFKLTDLLKILPKTLTCEHFYICPLMIMYDYEGNKLWIATYDDFDSLDYFKSEELIDALYELTIWCIKKGHLKFD